MAAAATANRLLSRMAGGANRALRGSLKKIASEFGIN